MTNIAMLNGKRRFLRGEAFDLLRAERHTRNTLAVALGIVPNNASRILWWLNANGYVIRRGASNRVSYIANPRKRRPKNRSGMHPNSRKSLVTYEYAKGLRLMLANRGLTPTAKPGILLEECWPSLPCRCLTDNATRDTLDTLVVELCPPEAA